METTRYTLFELNEHIRRIMALNFTDAIWISCELSQVSVSRGHMYLNLIEKEEPDPILGGEGDIIAQSDAVIWARELKRLKLKLGTQFEAILQAGLEVLVKAKIDYHERYGLKLNIVDIDPAFTVGKLELRRRAVLEQLQKKGLLDKNKLLSLPPVIQHVAVISSESAAGYKDFQEQLINNPYGYQINTRFFNAAMQGERVRLEVTRQIEKINELHQQFDCVVMIRGGGAKLDLVAFDDEALCTALANCKIPVITGIGHEIDESIADLVAFRSLKTPTAVAEWVIQQNMYFESELLECGQAIKALAQGMLNDQHLQLESIFQQVKIQSQSQVQNQQRLLDYIIEQLPRNVSQTVKAAHQELSHLQTALNLLDPQQILNRGFSMTMKDSKPMVSAQQLKDGDLIETIFLNGKISSKVVK